VLDSKIDDETVMMDIDQGSYFGLNETGTWIWALLKEPTVVADLCDRLMEDFDVPREQCEQQVVGFLEELLNRGLLQVMTDEFA